MTRPPIRTAIIDDEPLARAVLRQLVEQDPDIVVVGDTSGVDAPALIERTAAELVFLDVQMPERDGFGVLAALPREALPQVVFVTAHDAYAVRAFEVHAIDYLLKPFDDARLHTALARAKQRLARPGDGADAAGVQAQLRALLADTARAEPAPLERLLVRTRGKVIAIRAADIDWIEAADYYATLHVGGAAHLVRQTLAELEANLDPRRFVRVHRKAIVNIDRIREIHPLFRGDCTLVLSDGTQVRLSRTRRAEFERLFGTAT